MRECGRCAFAGGRGALQWLHGGSRRIRPIFHSAIAMTVAARTCTASSLVEMSSGPARWWADLPAADGGSGLHPTPHELLDAALAACTVLTVQRYARRRHYPLEGVQAQVSREPAGTVYRLRRRLELAGPLAAAQRADLLRVADACPVHQALAGSFEVLTELVG